MTKQPDIPGIPPPPKKRGRPPKPDAMTPAERQAKRRAKLREEVANVAPRSMTVAQALEAYRLAAAAGDWNAAAKAAERLLAQAWNQGTL